MAHRVGITKLVCALGTAVLAAACLPHPRHLLSASNSPSAAPAPVPRGPELPPSGLPVSSASAPASASGAPATSSTAAPSVDPSGAPAEPAPSAAPPVASSSAAPEPLEPPPVELHPYHEPIPRIASSAPAMRYANLTPSQCRKELQRRALPFTPHKSFVRGIAIPLHVAGPMHGVTFVTGRPPSPYGLLDCRLALVLDDFAKLLADFDVSKVVVGSMYRPRARIGGRGRPSQHSYGLAMDIVSMRLRDGRLLKVERDFHGQLRGRPCGSKAVMTDPNESSIVLRNIVCAVARAGLFHHMITPCGDRAHRDHLHFDIKRDVQYQSFR